ncbi:unnamed protein product [Euphydryas editha]|uniref:Uncharacterized protein n=1 Tax=Euphydryas editha TaxID=104508 RepID=A0AAU9USC7_EUPED|nr:unnamed protein product [Euphydryas editha]
MSDYEEPAAKVSKVEVAPKEPDEEMDEGHEEWLSEGILTDDDFNPTAEESNLNTSLDDTQSSLPETVDPSHDIVNNIPQDGNNSKNVEGRLDNTETANQTELPEELGAFLIRKTDGKVIEQKKAESETDDSKHSGDDGHDTDELLRMLGGDESQKEVNKIDQKEQESSDDDEYIFEGAKVARLKVARNVIMKKYPRKAVPEESDGSSDEGQTVKRMFGVKRVNFAAKSTAKTSSNVAGHAYTPNKSKVTSTPLPKQTIQPKMNRVEPDEIIDEDEFLEEDLFDLDEDLGSSMEGEGEGGGEREGEAEGEEGGLRLMRPERMDEDAPSDPDSNSGDESLYDELPSSDSDDQNEWFALDVRAERAGDYIPLLGAKARQLLLAEKQRVSTRLSHLKQSMATLNESSTQQAETLRRATLQLAELDAALKA